MAQSREGRDDDDVKVARLNKMVALQDAEIARLNKVIGTTMAALTVIQESDDWEQVKRDVRKLLAAEKAKGIAMTAPT